MREMDIKFVCFDAALFSQTGSLKIKNRKEKLFKKKFFFVSFKNII